MTVIRDNGFNLKPDELEHAVYTIRQSGFATYVGRSDDEKEFTVRCCHIRPPSAAGHLAHACEVVADAVGLDPKEQVRYEPRKKLTIYPALKSAILDIFRD